MSKDNLGNEYCDCCGKLLPKEKTFSFGGGGKHRFKDGTFCEKCATIKVNLAREKLK